MPNKFAVCVVYPLTTGRMTLRAGPNWSQPIEGSLVADGRTIFQFESEEPFVHFKPMLERDGQSFWSVGTNYLVTAATRTIYPHFFSGQKGSLGDVLVVERESSEAHRVRVYYPPGYEENTLKRYPTLYMHDAQNLFVPGESFLGVSVKVDETLELLDAMNVVDKVVVVAIYPNDRAVEYTKRGYVPYGKFLAGTLKPLIDQRVRTLATPESTAVMGASLGGVVSLHVLMAHRDAFGMCGCLSSTFGYDDDLFERVSRASLRGARIYLDSGWPGDNFESTRAMRDLLRLGGMHFGRDYLYFAYPNHVHNERFWATRSHIPFQFFFGGPR